MVNFGPFPLMERKPVPAVSQQWEYYRLIVINILGSGGLRASGCLKPFFGWSHWQRLLNYDYKCDNCYECTDGCLQKRQKWTMPLKKQVNHDPSLIAYIKKNCKVFFCSIAVPDFYWLKTPPVPLVAPVARYTVSRLNGPAALADSWPGIGPLPSDLWGACETQRAVDLDLVLIGRRAIRCAPSTSPHLQWPEIIATQLAAPRASTQESSRASTRARATAGLWDGRLLYLPHTRRLLLR